MTCENCIHYRQDECPYSFVLDDEICSLFIKGRCKWINALRTNWNG